MGAKGLGVLHHLPISPIFPTSQNSLKFRYFRHILPPPKPKKRPKIAKHTKHEPLPKRDAISLKFPEESDLRTRPTTQKCTFPSRENYSLPKHTKQTERDAISLKVP